MTGKPIENAEVRPVRVVQVGPASERSNVAEVKRRPPSFEEARKALLAQQEAEK
jgi:hypothetical protein